MSVTDTKVQHSQQQHILINMNNLTQKKKQKKTPP